MPIRFSPVSQFVPGITPPHDAGLSRVLAHLRDQRRIDLQAEAEERMRDQLAETARNNRVAAAQKGRQLAEAARSNRARDAREQARLGYDVEREAMKHRIALHPEREQAIYEAAGMVPGMVASSAPATAAHQTGYRGRAASAMDDLLGPVPGAVPVPEEEAVPEGGTPAWFQQDVKALRGQFEAIAKLDGVDHRVRQAAREAAAGAEEALRNAGGDTVEAASSLRELNRANLGATKPPSSLLGGPFDRKDLKTGYDMAKGWWQERVEPEANVFSAIDEAKQALRDNPDNPAAISRAVFGVAVSLNGTRPTDKDVAAVFGLDSIKSLVDQGYDFIVNKIEGAPDKSKFLANLLESLNTAEARSAKRLSSAINDTEEATRRYLELDQTTGRSFSATMEPLVGRYKHMLDIRAKEDARVADILRERKKAAGKPRGDKPKSGKPDYDPLSEEGWE